MIEEHRYLSDEDKKQEATLVFENFVFSLQKIGVVVINWVYLPLILLCLAFGWWVAMFVLTCIWVFSLIVYVLSIHLYRFGVFKDWWDFNG